MGAIATITQRYRNKEHATHSWCSDITALLDERDGDTMTISVPLRIIATITQAFPCMVAISQNDQRLLGNSL